MILLQYTAITYPVSYLIHSVLKASDCANFFYSAQPFCFAVRKPMQECAWSGKPQQKLTVYLRQRGVHTASLPASPG